MMATPKLIIHASTDYLKIDRAALISSKENNLTIVHYPLYSVGIPLRIKKRFSRQFGLFEEIERSVRWVFFSNG
jgi:hypothetical protein